jgi:hypothetical protein
MPIREIAEILGADRSTLCRYLPHYPETRPR